MVGRFAGLGLLLAGFFRTVKPLPVSFNRRSVKSKVS